MKKKLLIFTSIFFLLFAQSASAAGNVYVEKVNAPPGYHNDASTSINPSSCAAAFQNTEGSGDHLYASLVDTNGYSGAPPHTLWGTPVEEWNVLEDLFYFTPTSTTSCESYDGAHGEVRNENYPTEHLIIHYFYNL